MNKSILIALSLSVGVMFSCSNEDINIPQSEEQPLNEKVLSIEEASTLLKGFITYVHTKSTISTEIKGHKVKEFYIDNKDVLPVSAKDTIVVYEFLTETDGQEGYAIVVGDRRINRVIASVPFGSLSDTLFIEPLRLYFRSIPDFLRQDLAEHYAGVQKKMIETKMTAETCYHFLPTIWGQESPYNLGCPTASCYDGHYPAGCIPIAVAQLLAYYKKPSNLSWTTILASSTVKNSSSTTVKNQVSGLIAEIGSRININYRCSGSGIPQATAVTAIPEVLRSYGLGAGSFTAYSIEKCIQSLQNGYPILFMAQSSEGGHAWICDAWKRHIYDSSTYYDYLDMNWGWSGLSNGFFSINDPLSFPTDKATFNSDFKILTNVH